MFNTLRYAKILERVGISRELADAQMQIFAEIVEGELVTKHDVKELTSEIRLEFSQARNDLKNQIDALKYQIEKQEYKIVIKLGALVTAVVSVAVAVLSVLKLT